MYFPGKRDGVLQEYGKHVTRIGIRIYESYLILNLEIVIEN